MTASETLLARLHEVLRRAPTETETDCAITGMRVGVELLIGDEGVSAGQLALAVVAMLKDRRKKKPAPG